MGKLNQSMKNWYHDQIVRVFNEYDASVQAGGTSEEMREWYKHQVSDYASKFEGIVDSEYSSLVAKKVANIQEGKSLNLGFAPASLAHDKEVTQEFLDKFLNFQHFYEDTQYEETFRLQSDFSKKSVMLELRESSRGLSYSVVTETNSNKIFYGANALVELIIYLNNLFEVYEHHYLKAHKDELVALFKRIFDQQFADEEILEEATNIVDITLVHQIRTKNANYVFLISEQTLNRYLDIGVLKLTGLDWLLEIPRSRVNVFEDLYRSLITYGFCREWWYGSITADFDKYLAKDSDTYLRKQAGRTNAQTALIEKISIEKDDYRI